MAFVGLGHVLFGFLGFRGGCVAGRGDCKPSVIKRKEGSLVEDCLLLISAEPANAQKRLDERLKT